MTRLFEILVSYTCQIREDPVNLAPTLDPKLPYLCVSFGLNVWFQEGGVEGIVNAPRLGELEFVRERP